MPVFEYKALDSNGKKNRGILDAGSKAQATAKLRSQNLFPVSITLARKKTSSHKDTTFVSGLFNRITNEEITVMTRQMATLLNAGISLPQVLSSLVKQTYNPQLQRVIAQIKESVNEGLSFKNALEKHPNQFSSIYVNMVASGEMSGSLDLVLERLAEFGEKQEVLRAKVRAALIYPLVMGAIGASILLILLTYVVPNIVHIFQEMDQLLPFPTRILLLLSDFFSSYWWSLLVLLSIMGALFHYAQKHRIAVSFLDKLRLNAIIIGPVNRKIILARLSSTLSSLLKSGVSLVNAMIITRSLVNNTLVAKVIDEAIEQIQQGNSMNRAFSHSSIFPPMFVQMVAVGEQSGELEKMLDKAAAVYEREVETAILTVTSLIEPVMIVTMGITVGFIVLSILLPIFEMNQMIG